MILHFSAINELISAYVSINAPKFSQNALDDFLA